MPPLSSSSSTRPANKYAIPFLDVEVSEDNDDDGVNCLCRS